MPRQGRVFKKRPKGFHGSHKKKKEDPGPSVSSDIKFSDFESETDEILESDIDTTLPRSSTSSEKLQDRLHEYSESEEDKYDVLNVQQISEMLKKIAVCKSCGGMLNFSVIKRIGYAAELEVLCMECMASVKEMSSEKMEESGLYHVNLRMCYAFRTIGKGFNGAKMFSAMANLPPPHSRFSKHEEIIESAAENVAMDSMKSAVEETVVCNDNSRDITVAVDGTWQKRGHSSLNGVVSVTSGETGKVLDVAVMSKFCRCPRRLHQEHEPNCVANYEGTSGGMEVQGAKEIFFRSEELYGVRYVKYLGDGDTKAFKEILAAAPYGPSCPIEKLECVGHVQKRMGTRLRNLKAQWGKKVLADGKSIGGKNRLTDKAILAIQNFYGLAIRRNTGDLEKMKKAIWAVFFHLSSSDAEPCHILCDKTWCKYLAATEEGGTYCHAEHTHIPRIIMEAIKPIFRDLANPKLIEKCLHGKTQNPNESFNNIIWTRVPKNIFVRLRTLKMGVYDAVSTFNDGNISRCRVLEKLGMKPGYFTVEALKKIDLERIRKANKETESIRKKVRQKRSLARKKLEDQFKENEGDEPSYAAGNF